MDYQPNHIEQTVKQAVHDLRAEPGYPVYAYTELARDPTDNFPLRVDLIVWQYYEESEFDLVRLPLRRPRFFCEPSLLAQQQAVDHHLTNVAHLELRPPPPIVEEDLD